ncbi:RNA polymerase I specific transcription initiation factor RRN3 [Nakaseomyces glabratus]|nr:RNA polymerase I specific transcription initiation factor RRN3 [Nakaseomyces glabratus]KAH7580131.1 RNA polymerase I specific transcription initiation factor RRN3 [Nakaseomyces glabratus]
MMVFESNNKRPATEELPDIESKKPRVDIVGSTEIYVEAGNDAHFSDEIYRKFIKNALDELEKNDPMQINAITSQISLSAKNPDRISTKNFTILLEVLSNNINKVDSSKGLPLIQCIINFEKWWELPDPALGKYIFFIKVLCSSIPKWWQDVAMIMISSFILSSEKTTQHHELLKYFLRMIPSSMSYIDSYLIRYFPNKNDSKKNIVNYISNVLMLTSYCQELKFQAWSLIMERVISIDVELQNELDELDDDIDDEMVDDDGDDSDEDEDDEDEDHSGAEDDAEDDEDEDDGDDFDDADGQEEYNIDLTQGIKELSNKLDAILSLLSSEIIKDMTPEKLESGEGIGTFNTLTTLFKTHILPTYYTRSVQYIMFHLSQQQLELMDSYLVTLIDISFAANETSEKRIKSLQYLGSYIARAKKLSRTQIVFVASYLTSWLNRYVIEREEEVNQPGGMDRFKHFYAAFQALCYIFCFRHKDLRDVDGSWECELDKFFTRMVISKFNPLKYCNENVMLMFARIAQEEDVAYCFSIIENNNNELLRGIMGKADSSRGGTPTPMGPATSWSLATRQQFIDLQSYFPYDPLFLKNYKNMMKEYYIEWSEAGGEYESDGSDE